MHQDVYNEMFDGEGAPSWAVCTNGVPSVDPPGRWSLEYAHQGRRHRLPPLLGQQRPGRPAGPVRPGLGRRGARVPREPLGPRLRPLQRAVLHVARPLRRRALRRPARVLLHRHGPHRRPVARRAAAALPARRPGRAASSRPSWPTTPAHLIFDEPDNYASRGLPTYLGPMDLPNLVYNVHIYCGARSPVTGNPTNVAAVRRPGRALARRAGSRTAPRWPRPPSRAGRPGSSPSSAPRASPQLLAAVTAAMDARQGRVDLLGLEVLRRSRRGARPSRSSWPTGVCARPRCVLSRAYPQAVAGTPDLASPSRR